MPDAGADLTPRKASVGFPDLTYTQVPDQILDGMGDRPYTETLVLLYLAKWTIGIGRSSATISYRQFLSGVPGIDTGCGIKSRGTLSSTLKSLCDQRQIVVNRPVTQYGAWDVSIYRLAMITEIDSTDPQDERTDVQRSSLYRKLVAAYGEQCLRCEIDGPLVVDHIIPRSLGGTDHIDNRQLLCASCNEIKDVSVIDYRDAP